MEPNDSNRHFNIDYYPVRTRREADSLYSNLIWAIYKSSQYWRRKRKTTVLVDWIWRIFLQREQTRWSAHVISVHALRKIKRWIQKKQVRFWKQKTIREGQKTEGMQAEVFYMYWQLLAKVSIICLQHVPVFHLMLVGSSVSSEVTMKAHFGLSSSERQ